MNIAIIIPVVQVELAKNLLNQIKKGSCQPDQVIVIDNSISGFVSPIHACQQIRPGKTPLPVNVSWTLGISHLRSDIDIIGILNDDIIVTDDFLSKAVETFDTRLNCGIAIPIQSTKDGLAMVSKLNRAHKTKKRSGWAYFIRRTALEQIPLIPDDLVLFFGDAWLFQNTSIKGWYRYHMIDNPVFHYGGTTLRQGRVGVYRCQRERERILYRNYIKEIKSCRTQART